MASSSSAPSGTTGGSRPAPLDISGGSTSSSRTDYYNYNSTAESPTSPASTTTPFFGRDNRTAYGSSPPDSAKSVKSPRKVNANSYCGRHSDEFLFGGMSIGDLWRAVKK